jgi:hypothetical protein
MRPPKRGTTVHFPDKERHSIELEEPRVSEADQETTSLLRNGRYGSRGNDRHPNINVSQVGIGI